MHYDAYKIVKENGKSPSSMVHLPSVSVAWFAQYKWKL